MVFNAQGGSSSSVSRRFPPKHNRTKYSNDRLSVVFHNCFFKCQTIPIKGEAHGNPVILLLSVLGVWGKHAAHGRSDGGSAQAQLWQHHALSVRPSVRPSALGFQATVCSSPSAAFTQLALRFTYTHPLTAPALNSDTSTGAQSRKHDLYVTFGSNISVRFNPLFNPGLSYLFELSFHSRPSLASYGSRTRPGKYQIETRFCLPWHKTFRFIV